MSGVDLLGGNTGNPPVSRRSEAEQGILFVKEGIGMYDRKTDPRQNVPTRYHPSPCTIVHQNLWPFPENLGPVLCLLLIDKARGKDKTYT
jgi:hypothetical protein